MSPTPFAFPSQVSQSQSPKSQDATLLSLSLFPCFHFPNINCLAFLSLPCSSMTGSLSSMSGSCLQQREPAHPAASYSYMFAADPLSSLGSYGSRAGHCGSAQAAVSSSVNSHSSYGANTHSAHGGAASQYHGEKQPSEILLCSYELNP